MNWFPNIVNMKTGILVYFNSTQKGDKSMTVDFFFSRNVVYFVYYSIKKKNFKILFF